MRKRMKKASPAMGVALIALFIALSGTTYAATGGNFILGQGNTATTQTSLSSNVASAPTLNVVNTGGRPAARFQANGGTAPFTVSNSTKVANLNADNLDGLSANGLTRTTLAVGARTVSFSGTPQSLATATLVVPASGFVSLEASAAAEDIFSPAACANCLIRIELVDNTTGVVSRESIGRVGANSGATRDIDSLAVGWTFPATAGTRTYTLRGQFVDQSGGGGSVNFANAILQAHFTPFGYNGGSTLAPTPVSSTRRVGSENLERHGSVWVGRRE